MRFVLVPLLFAAAMPAGAAESGWQELAPDVRARLISSDVLTAGGTTQVALELDMPVAYNTYWSVPGETGLPTQLDFSASSGIAGHAVLWPYPIIETTKGYVDFVYRGATILPIDLQVSAAAPRLQVSVVMGICSDICIPASADFTLPLDFARPDVASGLRIAQAVALTPLEWDGPGDALTVRYDAAAAALAIAVTSPDIDPLSILADAGASGLLFGAPQKSPEGRLVLLPLLGGASGQGLGNGAANVPVQLTFMTAMGPFWVSRDVDLDGSTPAGQ